MQQPFNGDLDSRSIIQLLQRNGKTLAALLLLTAVLTYIFTLPVFITPLYRSTVILYPTSTNSISKVLLSTTALQNKDLLEFGEDEQTERMLQILNSNRIRDRVIEKFNLMDHYGIKPGTRYRNTRLFNEYESKIRFRRTEYMAVKITVLDKNPAMCALIANEIAELFDSTMNAMQKEVATRAFQIVEGEFLKLRDHVRKMEDSLNVLRRLGVHDYESQAEMINQQLAIELAGNNREGIRRLEERLDILAEYGGPYVSIRDMLEHERKQLALLRARYEEAKVDATEDLPHKFVVTSAYEAERKAYPIRWLILLISLSSVFFLSMLVMIYLDQYQGESKKKGFTWPKWPTIRINIPIPEITTKPQENKSIAKPVVQQIAKDIKAEKSTENIKHNTSITMDNYFNNTAIVRLMIRWRKHLAVIVLVAAVLGAIFSGPFFITPLYRSEAVVYPANINSYSDESETEQMLQIMQSHSIVDSMIRIFNLAEHYKIDPGYKYYQTALFYEYSQNVRISKTPYEAVSVSVRDKNPMQAAKMAEEIIRLYDGKVAKLHKSKYLEVIEMYEKQLSLKRAVIDSLQNRLYTLGTEYGLIDYSIQSQEIMRGYLRTVYGSNLSNINTPAVNELKNNIERFGGELLVIVEMLQHESRTFVDARVEYEQVLRFYNANLSYSNIITYPFVSDKKVFPVRWVIVALSMLGALLLSMLVIFMIENKHLIVGIQQDS